MRDKKVMFNYLASLDIKLKKLSNPEKSLKKSQDKDI